MVRLCQSQVLLAAGIRHGFSTRMGGVSSGPYATLNLSASWGDDPALAAENLRLLAEEGGFDPGLLCQVIQVHGTRAVTLSAPERRRQEADGMATAERLVLGVSSADCVSLLLGDGQGRVGAAHAGWRGTLDGMAGAAVTALVQLGVRPVDLRAALGPSIGPCCFEVQRDVADRFAQTVPRSVIPRQGRLYVDLWAANRDGLLAAGLLPEHIDAAPPCTMCHESMFFSYRRDGGRIGQHLAFIVGGQA